MDTITGKGTDPIPSSGDVDVTFGTPYKSVDINVQTFGNRPTANYKRSPAPNNDDCDVLGNTHLGGYSVTVGWPAGATEPTITITP